MCSSDLIGVHDKINPRFEFRFAFEIGAPEPHAAVRRARQEGHVHAIAAMQADAGEAHIAPQCLLLCHGAIKQTEDFYGKRRRLCILTRRALRKATRDHVARR